MLNIHAFFIKSLGSTFLHAAVSETPIPDIINKKGFNDTPLEIIPELVINKGRYDITRRILL